MTHRCKTCCKEFRKASARRQHEQAVHVERPKQRRAEARRLEYEAERRRPITPTLTDFARERSELDRMQDFVASAFVNVAADFVCAAIDSGLDKVLAEAARSISVKRDFLFLNCQDGHRWKSIGGRNCGCEWTDEDGVHVIGGSCSIPVLQCEVCGDCDYGENDEAKQIKADCASERKEAKPK